MAVTQIAHDCAGRRYYERKLSERKTRKEALRALKRRISDAIYRQLIADAKRQAGPGGQAGTTPENQHDRPNPTGRLFGEVTAWTRTQGRPFAASA